jgi:hypothetical protein
VHSISVESTERIISNNSSERGKLIIVNNALNEVCNGLYIDEFETRIGFSIIKISQ